MPIILTIANQKGGCGKTTTTMNVAGALHGAGYRVMVVDADPQASASYWSLAGIARGEGGIPFDVRPAHSLGYSMAEVRSQSHQFILIDSPPGSASSTPQPAMVFAKEALRRSDGVLVPLQPSMLDFAAAKAFVRLLLEVKPVGVKTGVLINARQHRTMLGDSARDTAIQLFAPVAGAVVFESTIGRRSAIVQVSGSGQTIFEYAPSHKASLEYFALTKEIVQWLIPSA